MSEMDAEKIKAKFPRKLLVIPSASALLLLALAIGSAPLDGEGVDANVLPFFAAAIAGSVALVIAFIQVPNAMSQLILNPQTRNIRNYVCIAFAGCYLIVFIAFFIFR